MRTAHCGWAGAVTVAVLAVAVAISSVPSIADDAGHDAAAEALFSQASVTRLQIRLSEKAAESLRSEPRTWTTCRLIENGDIVHDRVAIKIKGGYGSFRELEDRPALTLNMDKHVTGRRFHGLDKFHLNNSVQDESLLREFLGAELFRIAGIPAPRVTHVRVFIGERDVGLYVLKESFDEDFLRRSFRRSDGNLYDGRPNEEIDDGLTRDEGRRGDAGADLAALADACRVVDDATRFAMIDERLDVDSFLTFAAVEAIAGHWDGYCSARNNYRVYVDPDVGDRVRFLPHGMDQILTDPGMGLFEPPPALVAMAVLEHPDWRRRYRERVAELLPLAAADRLLPAIDRTAERLRPELTDIGPESLERFTVATNDLRTIIVDRAQSLREQVDAPEPPIWPTRLQAAVRALNAADTATDEPPIPNRETTDFLRNHVPWFECPDPEMERAYYRRWWTLRRHVRHTEEGPVVTDLPQAFGDLLTEARWLRDLPLSGLASARQGHPVAADETSCDRIITGVIGLKVHPDAILEVDPAPPKGWRWFGIDRITYQGRRLTILWDDTGERYGCGPGLRVFVDGQEIAHAKGLERIVGRLP